MGTRSLPPMVMLLGRTGLLLVVLASLLLSSECAVKKRRTAAEWDEIAKKQQQKEYEEEEEERKANMPPMEPFDPSKMNSDPNAMQRLMAQSKAGKAAMMFVTVDVDTRKQCDEFAARSRSMLKDANGVDAQAYVIEDDKILYSIMDGRHGFKIKEILLTMPEVAEFEWDQQKTPGKAKAVYDKKKANRKPSKKVWEKEDEDKSLDSDEKPPK